MDTLCLQCNRPFLARRKTAKFCSDSCKLKYNRSKQKSTSDTTSTSAKEPVNAPIANNLSPSTSAETYEQRLERRVKETGSQSTITIKVNFPPEASVEVPSKYEDEDLDAAKAHVLERDGQIKGIEWNVAKFERKNKQWISK